MNVFGVAMIIGAVVFLINKVYRTPGKVVFTESDNVTVAPLLNINTEAVSKVILDSKEPLVLQETATAGDVLVKAKSVTTGYEAIGHLQDAELYKKVQQKRARAKIAAVNGSEITIEYSYS